MPTQPEPPPEIVPPETPFIEPPGIPKHPNDPPIIPPGQPFVEPPQPPGDPKPGDPVVPPGRPFLSDCGV